MILSSVSLYLNLAKLTITIEDASFEKLIMIFCIVGPLHPDLLHLMPSISGLINLSLNVFYLIIPLYNYQNLI